MFKTLLSGAFDEKTPLDLIALGINLDDIAGHCFDLIEMPGDLVESLDLAGCDGRSRKRQSKRQTCASNKSTTIEPR